MYRLQKKAIENNVKAKNFYIVSGCNGAGKTTASMIILPEILDCKEFLNAENIAQETSSLPFGKANFDSGRVMIERMDNLLNENSNFAVETTLSSRCYKSKILEAKQKGYNVTLLFFWLQTIELAVERVRIRIEEGGHDVEPDIIERRYIGGIRNLFDLYLSLVDTALIFDNSEGMYELIAEKFHNDNIIIINETKFNNLKKFYNDNKR